MKKNKLTKNMKNNSNNFIVEWDKNSLKKYEVKAILGNDYSPTNDIKYLEYPETTKKDNETEIALVISVPYANEVKL